MKDRVRRTNIKKPSHRLFRMMIVVSSLTMVFGGLFTFLFVSVSNENATLTKKIENYSVQIDMLEDADETMYLKHNTNKKD